MANLALAKQKNVAVFGLDGAGVEDPTLEAEEPRSREHPGSGAMPKEADGVRSQITRLEESLAQPVP